MEVAGLSPPPASKSVFKLSGGGESSPSHSDRVAPRSHYREWLLRETLLSLLADLPTEGRGPRRANW